ncbi:MAG: sigma-54-dependent Fis family transcriptional regulator [Bradymonadaceae bacterium]|nr:sigma-54-dependent Fis family transcriptional regulator [Lujinxingiaceae bacterium]
MKDTLLLALGGLIRKEISAGQLLQHIVDVMAEFMDADRGTIYLLDEACCELVSVAGHLPEIGEIRVPTSQGVAGFVARSGRVVNLPFCEDDHRFWPSVDNLTGYTTRTMLAGPLHNGAGKLIGVVQLLNKRDGIFSEADQRNFAILSEQAAALLEETTLGVSASPLATTAPTAAPGEPEAHSLNIGEGFNRIVGRGEAMREVFRTIGRVAPMEATVLLRGESGTGKGLIARALHHNSGRKAGPFIQVDCTTLPEGLMENELFGHERGAYTGAHTRMPGKVEAASTGTLFLDEIGDLPLTLQGKLLTLLQEHSYCPVGSARRLQADIRIVTATNRELERLVDEGRFREDLYYRLRVVQIELPALRGRGRDDLIHLINHFVTKASRRHSRPVVPVRPDALSMLLEYHWPGNVRELENCIESAVIFSDLEISPSTLSLPRPDATRKVRALSTHEQAHQPTSSSAPEPVDFGRQPTLREIEARYIQYLLELYEGNRSACARALDIGRNTLLRKMKDYELE